MNVGFINVSTDEYFVSYEEYFHSKLRVWKIKLDFIYKTIIKWRKQYLYL